MLVVIGIIAVLIAVLIPAVTSMRRSARVAHCASNLRQIGQALTAYRSDQRTWPVTQLMPAPFNNPNAKWPAAPALPEALAAFLPRGSNVYRCPGDNSNASVFERYEAAQRGNGISYIYAAPAGELLPGRSILLWDFLGKGTSEDPLFHPPYRGSRNALDVDGSVTYKPGRPPWEP